jgi:GT2 family glycosyltransferase
LALPVFVADSGVRERTFRPSFVTTFDLTRPTGDLTVLSRYSSVSALVRIAGTPIGVVQQPVIQGKCGGTSLRRAALNELRWPIMRHLLIAGLARGYPRDGLDHAALGAVLSTLPAPVPASPSVTVVVCTRDRTASLRRCLAALLDLDPQPDEILVLDNAPATSATAELVAGYPSVRHVVEHSAGLDRARSRGALEANGEIVAYTDDDVVVDRDWVGALRRAFQDERVDAVTGLVLPLELETPAQALFERYGGFGRGFLRRWYRIDQESGQRAVPHAGAGKFGTGANMAFRRKLFGEIGLFDPTLDVGTPANGGGDLEMFYRVVKTGHLLVYDPGAIVQHAHRRDYDALREQLTNHGIGFYAYLTRVAMLEPRDALALSNFGLRWLLRWDVRRFLQTWFKPGMFPRGLTVAELTGSLRGPFRLRRSLQLARDMDGGSEPARKRPHEAPDASQRARSHATARRVVDVREPVGAITGVGGVRAVAIDVVRGADRIGEIVVDNHGGGISADEVRQSIVESLGIAVLGRTDIPESDRYCAFETALRDLFPRSARPARRPLDSAASVSVVIATRDRPGDLKRALDSIQRQRTNRPIEIIVVDNNPLSDLTPAAVTGRPNVRLVSEPRAGLSYARNRGILASTSTIVISTDDDVVVPPDWVETLIAPFRDPNVMAVTGNVVPDRMVMKPERLFEAYGGLGRGTLNMRVDGTWFREFRRAVPTWRLGGTANAAFRSTIFSDPAIGLLDESLGAGTPSGCSEDTDLFYRILREGFRIVYEPRAVVRHRHRQSMPALRRQLYAYAKGHVAYQLTTLKRDRDLRALVRLLFEMPDLYWWRIRTRLSGESEYPLSLVFVEIAGFIAGPWAWWRSRRRARRLGPSGTLATDSLKCSTS